MIDTNVEDLINETIKNLNLIKKITIVRITHHLNRIFDSTRVIALANGLVEYDGDYKNLFSNDSLIKNLKIEEPFIFSLSKQINKTNKKINITFDEEELIGQLKKEK